jgi:hypothetical protein
MGLKGNLLSSRFPGLPGINWKGEELIPAIAGLLYLFSLNNI